MTETLNYDPTPADAPEFTEEEQAALEVADKLGQEENDLILGKFKDADDLARAYSELEKKLGSGEDDDSEVDTEEDTEEEEWSEGASLIAEASEEYFSNDGKLSEETMQKFAEMSSTDLVNAYMEIQKNLPPPQQTESADLTDAEMNSIYNSAGGEKEYQRLVGWAAENLAENKLDAFNSIIDQGEALAIQMAVAGLRSEYENQEGYEGRMLTGKAAKTTDAFRSQAEVVAAMSDPRYDNDPAYRQDVYDKLERSNVAF